VKPLAASLDTVGLFARTVADLRLFTAVLAGPDLDDPTVRRAQPLAASGDEERRAPRIGLARTPHWDRVEPDAQAAIEAVVQAADAAGAIVEELALPGRFEDLIAAQTTIQWVESANALALELETAPEQLSEELLAALHEGGAIGLERYQSARRTTSELTPQLADILLDYDCLLTPSATGVPPTGLGHTGDPLFCRAWTAIGAPCISLPLAWTPSGLPAGLQLVSAPFHDGRALASAAWLLDRLGSAE
jgi:Asp-tRNA(Asn)/Glu-tRNA(Gln) amidotransferase A subunit family amidase